jgi:hypothetical protein
LVVQGKISSWKKQRKEKSLEEKNAELAEKLKAAEEEVSTRPLSVYVCVFVCVCVYAYVCVWCVCIHAWTRLRPASPVAPPAHISTTAPLVDDLQAQLWRGRCRMIRDWDQLSSLIDREKRHWADRRNKLEVGGLRPAGLGSGWWASFVCGAARRRGE